MIGQARASMEKIDMQRFYETVKDVRIKTGQGGEIVPKEMNRKTSSFMVLMMMNTITNTSLLNYKMVIAIHLLM